MKVNGDKIKAIREAKGWSREHLAIAAGVSSQAVFYWEKGDIGSFSTLKKVAEALGVAEQEILELENCVG